MIFVLWYLAIGTLIVGIPIVILNRLKKWIETERKIMEMKSKELVLMQAVATRVAFFDPKILDDVKRLTQAHCDLKNNLEKFKEAIDRADDLLSFVTQKEPLILPVLIVTWPLMVLELIKQSRKL